MRQFIIYGFIFLISASVCGAINPVPLSGNAGKSVLENITNITFNQTLNVSWINISSNQIINNTEGTPGDLWSWGNLPIGYTLNEFGKLTNITNNVDWAPSI
jgi:hypothetical protein